MRGTQKDNARLTRSEKQPLFPVFYIIWEQMKVRRHIARTLSSFVTGHSLSNVLCLDTKNPEGILFTISRCRETIASPAS